MSAHLLGCRAHALIRRSILGLASHVHAARMHCTFGQVQGRALLLQRLCSGRKRRALVAWAFVAGVLRWHRLRHCKRAWQAWRLAVQAGREQRDQATTQRRVTLLARAWSAWRAEFLQVR